MFRKIDKQQEKKSIFNHKLLGSLEKSFIYERKM
jgi:hypothetical protein